ALSMEDDEFTGELQDDEDIVGSDIEDRLETLFAEDDSAVSAALEGVELADDELGEADRDSVSLDEPAAMFDDATEKSIDFEDRLDSIFGDGAEAGSDGAAVSSGETAEVEDQVSAFFGSVDDALTAPADSVPTDRSGDLSDDDG